MTLYDSIYILAKKMAKSLQNGENPDALEESKLFNKEAKKQIQKNLSDEAIQEKIKEFEAIDADADWQNVASRLKVKKKSQISHFYKVAVVGILFISLTYLGYYHFNKTEITGTVNTTIQAGADKAILTLEDGTQIVLEAETLYKNEVTHTNGERLIYEGGNTSITTAFNYLTIPKGGQYQLALSDGTEIWLNADTKIKYPVAFKQGEPRLVELLYGEAYFDVSPSTKHGGDTFKVISRDQEVLVTGTEFNIKAYNDEQFIYTTLVEGRVQVAIDKKIAQLYPSEQSFLDVNSKQLTKYKVDVDLEIGWVKGYFNFKDKPLKDIMKVLSRWYDVEIYIASPTLEEVKFSGLLNKKQNIEDILNGIQNTNTINAYEIKNRTITIK